MSTSIPDRSSSPTSAMQLFTAKYPRLQQLVVGATLGASAYQSVNAFVKRKIDERQFTVSVSDSDELFEHTLAWLIKNMPISDRKSVAARTTSTRVWNGKLNEHVNKPNVRYVFEGDRTQTLLVNGHKVKVAIEQDAHGGSNRSFNNEDIVSSSPQYGARRSVYSFKLVFTCSTEAARTAVQDVLAQLYPDPVDASKTEFFTASTWGSWKKIMGARPRSLDSVILRGSLREELVSDMQRFLQQENEYERWSIPWHRGYLLYGKPGTGKTSIAAALAWHFNLNVYFLSLSSLKNDDNLVDLLSDLRERSMLILEDVDVVRAAHDRADDSADVGGVTLGGLINALDGLVTPHGMVTLMTTNRVDVLDEALVRSGRVDVKREIQTLDDDQLRRICQHFLGYVPSSLPSNVDETDLTAADALGVLKQHMEDPVAGGEALCSYLTEHAMHASVAS